MVAPVKPWQKLTSAQASASYLLPPKNDTVFSEVQSGVPAAQSHCAYNPTESSITLRKHNNSENMSSFYSPFDDFSYNRSAISFPNSWESRRYNNAAAYHPFDTFNYGYAYSPLNFPRNYASPQFGYAPVNPTFALENSWVGRTADTLGRFSHLLDLNTWFLDQLFDMAFNLMDRIRLIGSNLSWLPAATRPFTNRVHDFIVFSNDSNMQCLEDRSIQEEDINYSESLPSENPSDDLFPFFSKFSKILPPKRVLNHHGAFQLMIPICSILKTVKAKLGNIFLAKGDETAEAALKNAKTFLTAFVAYVLVGLVWRFFRRKKVQHSRLSTVWNTTYMNPSHLSS